MRRAQWGFLPFLLCLLWTQAPLWAKEAAAFRVGDTLPALALPDAEGTTHSLEETAKLLLFTRDQAGDELLDPLLAGQGLPLLARGEVVYCSDISGMPGIITKLFALPAMRKRPYAMLLDHEGQATARFPFREKQVTLIRLEERRITGIDYAGEAEALVKALRELSE